MTFLPISELGALGLGDWLVLLMLIASLTTAEIAHVLGTERSAGLVRVSTRFALPLLLIFTIIVLRRLVAL